MIENGICHRDDPHDTINVYISIRRILTPMFNLIVVIQFNKILNCSKSFSTTIRDLRLTVITVLKILFFIG